MRATPAGRRSVAVARAGWVIMRLSTVGTPRMGLKRSEYWALNVLALLALAIWVANVWLANGIQALQAEANANQQVLNQAAQLDGLNNQLAQALATASAQTGDADLRALLADNGITFTFTPEQSATPAGEEPGQ